MRHLLIIFLISMLYSQFTYQESEELYAHIYDAYEKSKEFPENSFKEFAILVNGDHNDLIEGDEYANDKKGLQALNDMLQYHKEVSDSLSMYRTYKFIGHMELGIDNFEKSILANKEAFKMIKVFNQQSHEVKDRQKTSHLELL